MKLRVLLTNGRRTVDLIWLEHSGRDVYYGGVGWPDKTSYHASGRRHTKDRSGTRSEIQGHQRLDAFTGQLQLCAFGIETGIVNSDTVSDYTGKKRDAVIWLDARTLPTQINVSLGLIEVGAFAAMLPVHRTIDLLSVHFVTSTTPWIYVWVSGTTTKPYDDIVRPARGQ